MKSETTKEEVKLTTPAETPKEAKAAKPVKDNTLRNQFAIAVADYVLKGMDITYLDGHASVPRMAEKVFLLADALVKEANK